LCGTDEWGQKSHAADTRSDGDTQDIRVTRDSFGREKKKELCLAEGTIRGGEAKKTTGRKKMKNAGGEKE